MPEMIRDGFIYLDGKLLLGSCKKEDFKRNSPPILLHTPPRPPVLRIAPGTEWEGSTVFCVCE